MTLRLTMTSVFVLLAATGCRTQPTGVWRTVGSAVENVEPTRTLYRDGVYLQDLEGVLVRRPPATDPEGPDRFGLRTGDGREVTFLENRKLQSLDRVLAQFRPDQVVLLRVSGGVTNYREINFMLLEQVFVKADTEIEVR